MEYLASETRYDGAMPYRRCGRSGLKLPAVSLGLWHNFGGEDRFETGRAIVRRAFDRGVTHFDLANNYGPPPGSAEETFGRILQADFTSHRDEMVLSTKAGFDMWEGPYGDWGSKKHLLASLDQSLGRMGLDYVDIFYSHRHDPQTPIEETMGALASAVAQGKALYVGLSNYPPQTVRQAAAVLRELGVACLIGQPRYNLFERDAEEGLFEAFAGEGMGCICYSPLAQGRLTDRYFEGVPEDSRAARDFFLKPGQIEMTIHQARKLDEVARERGQSLAQMAIAWTLRDARVTSALIGASRVEQLDANLDAAHRLSFQPDELTVIDAILGK